MPLNDIIRRAMDLNTVMGKTARNKAIEAAVQAMRGDPAATDEARYIAAGKKIHDAATRAIRNGYDEDDRQGSMFGLRQRYALDDDTYKDTDRLSRLEFRAIIARKKKQVADDTEHLERMERAERELSPIWDEYPDKDLAAIEIIWKQRRQPDAAN